MTETLHNSKALAHAADKSLMHLVELLDTTVAPERHHVLVGHFAMLTHMPEHIPSMSPSRWLALDRALVDVVEVGLAVAEDDARRDFQVKPDPSLVAHKSSSSSPPILHEDRLIQQSQGIIAMHFCAHLLVIRSAYESILDNSSSPDSASLPVSTLPCEQTYAILLRYIAAAWQGCPHDEGLVFLDFLVAIWKEPGSRYGDVARKALRDHTQNVCPQRLVRHGLRVRDALAGMAQGDQHSIEKILRVFVHAFVNAHGASKVIDLLAKMPTT